MNLKEYYIKELKVMNCKFVLLNSVCNKNFKIFIRVGRENLISHWFYFIILDK